MGGKEKTEKTRLIFTGHRTGALAERLHSLPDSRKLNCLVCSDIFDTIVKVVTTGSDSETIVCVDSKETGEFTEPFLRKLEEYGVICCCLDENGLTGNLLLPENVIIAGNRKQFETSLTELLPTGSYSSVEEPKHHREALVKPGFAPTKNEINALFGESDS